MSEHPDWHEQIERDLGPLGDYPPPDGPMLEPPTDVDLITTLAPQTLALEWGRTDLAFSRVQLERATAFAFQRQAQDQQVVTRRAGVILAARWNSPDCEKTMGVRCATDAFRGKRVTCRLCDSRFVAGVADDYYDATSATDGLCFGCVLLDTRTDAARDPDRVLVGTVVKPATPTRPRSRPRRRNTRTGAKQ